MVPPSDQTEGAAAAHAQRRHGVRDPGGRSLRPPLQPPVSLRLLPDPGVTGGDGQQRGLRLVELSVPALGPRVLALPRPAMQSTHDTRSLVRPNVYTEYHIQKPDNPVQSILAFP